MTTISNTNNDNNRTQQNKPYIKEAKDDRTAKMSLSGEALLIVAIVTIRLISSNTRTCADIICDFFVAPRLIVQSR